MIVDRREVSAASATTFPASFAQERLRIVLELHPPTPAYNVWGAWRLRGHVDPEALGLAVGQVVARHEALRTTFADAAGELVQIVAPPVPGPFPIVQAEAEGSSVDYVDVASWVGDVVGTIFDPHTGPLLRVGLLRIAETDHALVVCAHHLAFDGWSLGIFVREMSALYTSAVASRPADQRELDIQYADFAAWQRDWLTGDAVDSQLAWWKEALADAPPVLDLATDRPRPPAASLKGRTTPFALDAGVATRLRGMAAAHGATPFMAALAGFAAVLGRYASQTDVLIGSTVAGRSEAELERVIGFFVNTVVLRVDLRGDPTVAELLARVRESTLGAWEHQDLPFERLVQELDPLRDPARNPLFQVMLTMDPGPAPTPDLPGVNAERLDVDDGTSPFDLTLELAETEDTIRGALRSSTDLFDETTAARLLRHLSTVLAAMAEDPGRRVSDLPLVDDAAEAVGRVSATAAAAAGFKAVPDIVLAQADREPTAVAVRASPLGAGGEALTYGDLRSRSAALSSRLRQAGVGPGAVVAVEIGLVPDLLVAILGVWRAGAAWLAIDEAEPPERRRFMIGDAGCRVSVRPGLDIVVLEDAGTPPPPVAPPDRGAPIEPDDVAYVLYTSGSTGAPKGVLVTHGGVANYLAWAAETYPCGPGGVVPIHTSPAVDLTLTPLLLPLLRGATAVLIADDHWVSGLVAVALQAERVDLLKLTPSHLDVLAEHPDRSQVAGKVATLVVGGEALTYGRVDWWRRDAPAARVVNEYGPTETVVGCAAYVLDADTDRASGDGTPVPIGAPVRATSLYVLDAALRPVPEGVPGELFVGGPGVALGYTGRADLTAERFVPDPFGEPGGRLYRTGDRVRRLDDGDLVFLGRRDGQTKLRGHRVELGEIEATLGAHPSVAGAAVVTVDRGDAARLIAYVVAAGDAPDADTLRPFLRERLPRHMVPATFVIVDALPTTVSGKLDHRALAAIDAADPRRSCDSPRTSDEEAVAAVMAKVLRVERVGLTDDFFDLGGHSLLMMRMLALLRTNFDVDLSLRDVFAEPTVAAIAAAATARRDRAETVDGQGAATGATSGGRPLRRADRSAPIPLSPAQHRLWLLHRLDPERHDYNAPYAFRIHGALDLVALEGALDDLVARHEPLRTRFHERDGETTQVIDAPSPKPVDVLTAATATEAEALALDLARRPFRLEQDPPFRVALMRIDDHDHLLVIVVHHLVTDGPSTAVLLRDLSEFYAARRAGTDPVLPPLPLQFADVAAWESSRRTNGEEAESLEWWRETLFGAPPVLELPADRPRSAEPSAAGGVVRFVIEPALAEAVVAAAQTQGATPFMVGLAAYAALLARVTGQDDIVIGTPLSGRTRPGLEDIVGFFVNTVPIRVDVSGNPSFCELLGRVKQSCLGAFAHGDMSFGRIVETVHPERVGTRTPLVPVMFSLQPGDGSLRLAGVEVKEALLDLDTSHFDLTIDLWPRGANPAEGMDGVLNYSAELFDPDSAERLVRQYRLLLSQAVSCADRRVGEFGLLSPEEHEEIVVGFNPPTGRPGTFESVPARFERMADEYPDRCAIVCGKDSLTYSDVAGRARRLAATLADAGARPERLVGVLLPRGRDAVVGLLGVLGAGAAYVPLDPAYPRDRLAFLMEDAGIDLVVTSTALAALAGDATTIIVDEPGNHVPTPAGCFLPVDPDSAAYVIYTSGSTGRPKGVVLSHRNLEYALVSLEDDAEWRTSPEQRLEREDSTFTIASTASPSFDVFIGDVTHSLCSGATLLLCPDDVVRDPFALDRYLRDHHADGADMVPALVAGLVLAAETRGGDLSYLRHVVGGADVWRTADFVRTREVCGPGARVANSYGLTETAIDATRYEPPPGTVPAGAITPIGRPNPNTKVHLLDRNGAPVPVGVVGEIHVGGDGVARGYLGRPDLTAERFIPDPFGWDGGTRPGARLYRTGDLGRYRPDGTIEFLGRADEQLKVRGFRIEPAEVEAALTAHPAVQDVAVGARGDGPARMLVAWVVPAGEQPPAPSELRSFAAARVPEHMVPAVVVAVGRMPLTPNGKVDRGALPDPTGQRGRHDHQYVAPRSGTEEVIAGIWAQVLGVDRVGIHDDFFDLGGHSLLAPPAVARVEEALGVAVPLRTIFEHPTVAGLAAAVDEAGGSRLPIPIVDRTDGMPTSFNQQRLWFLDQLAPGTSAYNVPLAFRLRGYLDVDALQRAVDALVARHETLRTRFEARDGRPVQVVEEHVLVPVISESVEAAEDPDASARRLLDAHAREPFSLDRAPLLRVWVVRLAPDEHVLMCCMHHIVSDGWSLDVVFDEIAACYRAFLAGGAPELAPLSIQVGDFAAFQREQLTGERLEREVAYWRDTLAGAPPVIELPTDRHRPPAQSYRGAAHVVSVGPEVAQGVKAIAAQTGSTLYMVLLAAFDAFLRRITGQEEIVVGSPIAARHRPELEGLIGFFVNTLALRVDVSGDPSFIDLVKRVRRAALGAYAHQELPFERLVEELQPARELSYSPVFQVMFALQNAPFELPAMPGIEVEEFVVDRGGTPADLTVEVAEEDDGLCVAFTYATDLFDAPTIQRISSWFVHLLGAAAQNPGSRVSDLALLAEDEEMDLLSLCNQPPSAYPRDVGVHALIAEQALRHPSRIAVTSESVSLTYAEIEQHAGAVAARLLASGVQPGDTVGVCLPRSPALWAACLGVWKVGAAYVPLDSDYPVHRIRFMLADARCRTLITDPAGEASLADDISTTVLRFADIDLAGSPSAMPIVSGDDLAYVTYTSGSTGTPKGIAVPHRAIARLVRDTDYVQLAGDDVVAQASNASFDAATFEVWGALANGATLTTIATETMLDAPQVRDAIKHHGITTMFLTTAVFNLLAEADPACFGGLRSLLFGGETCEAEHVRAVLSSDSPPTRLIHVYGPTESTTFATWYQATTMPERARPVPIGRPVANTTAHVLADSGRPVPPGVVGELHLGGDGLAWGYMGRPDLTAERFVPDPFGHVPGSRLYRTGDLARLRPYGDIEFVGRADSQVKVRGFRIEPAEIEAELVTHPCVDEAVVVARQERTGTKSLVAYIAGAATGADVRAHLAVRLPAYMIPAAIVSVEHLPLTANGKVDRNALPDPPTIRDSGAEYEAPMTEMEQLVAGIFSQLLEVNRIGRHDDFFVLGGHSLLATQAAARLKDQLDIDVPLRLLFEQPTPARLGLALEDLRSKGGAPARPALRALPRRARPGPPA